MRREMYLMSLPCELWVCPKLLWRKADDASPPQLEGHQALIHHLEEQELRKKINRFKTQSRVARNILSFIVQNIHDPWTSNPFKTKLTTQNSEI